jgi:hypothetical protein
MGLSRGAAPSSDATVIGADSQDDASPGSDGRQSSLSREDVFEILSNRRRRFVIHYLQGNGNRASLGELAEEIAAWESGIEPEAVASDERKRVYTSLQQFHLPKLDDHEVVEFDDREGVIERTAAADDIDLYLEVVEQRDVPWSQYYVALAVANLGVLGAGLAGTYPLTLVSGYGWGIFVVTTFLISALLHTYVTRAEMRLGDTETPPEVVE